MKRFNILLVICLLLTISLRAQDEPVQEEGKDTKQYFPQSGTIGVGVDGTPIFNYVGNMFNGNNNNGLNFADTKLYLRYYLTDKSAVRLTIDIHKSKSIYRNYVRDDAAWAIDNNSTKELEDMAIINNTNYKFKAGYQIFRDLGRLRGFVGADLGYEYFKGKQMFHYGNEMNALNPSPTTTVFNPDPENPTVEDANSRLLEINNGARTNTFLLGLFTGAEYYLIPNLAIGCEFGLEFSQSWTGQVHGKTESMVNDMKVENEVAVSPKSSAFRVDTTVPYTYGSLYFIFHF